MPTQLALNQALQKAVIDVCQTTPQQKNTDDQALKKIADLLEEKADPNALDSKDELPPSYYAVLYAQPEILKLLLRYGADAEWKIPREIQKVNNQCLMLPDRATFTLAAGSEMTTLVRSLYRYARIDYREAYTEIHQLLISSRHRIRDEKEFPQLQKLAFIPAPKIEMPDRDGFLSQLYKSKSLACVQKSTKEEKGNEEAFKRQLTTLLGALANWGKRNALTIEAESFTSEFNKDKLFLYITKKEDNSIIELIKDDLENLLIYLSHQEQTLKKLSTAAVFLAASSAIEKQEQLVAAEENFREKLQQKQLSEQEQSIWQKIQVVFQEISAILYVCGPGINTNLDSLRRQATSVDSLVSYLDQGRRKLADDFAAAHIARKNIYSGNRVHVNIELYNYVEDHAWGICYGQLTPDDYSKLTAFSEQEKREFYAYYVRQYTPETITAKKIIEKIQTLLNTHTPTGDWNSWATKITIADRKVKFLKKVAEKLLLSTLITEYGDEILASQFLEQKIAATQGQDPEKFQENLSNLLTTQGFKKAHFDLLQAGKLPEEKSDAQPLFEQHGLNQEWLENCTAEEYYPQNNFILRPIFAKCEKDILNFFKVSLGFVDFSDTNTFFDPQTLAFRPENVPAVLLKLYYTQNILFKREIAWQAKETPNKKTILYFFRADKQYLSTVLIKHKEQYYTFNQYCREHDVKNVVDLLRELKPQQTAGEQLLTLIEEHDYESIRSLCNRNHFLDYFIAAVIEDTSDGPYSLKGLLHTLTIRAKGKDQNTRTIFSEVAKKLCENGANPNHKPNEDKESKTAFEIAAENKDDGQLPATIVLYANGFSTTLSPQQRCNILSKLINSRNWALTNQLLDAYLAKNELVDFSCSWNINETSGNTLLHLAVMLKKEGLVKKLCACGAYLVDLLRPNKAGNTPLKFAIQDYAARSHEETLHAILSIRNYDSEPISFFSLTCDAIIFELLNNLQREEIRRFFNLYNPLNSRSFLLQGTDNFLHCIIRETGKNTTSSSAKITLNEITRVLCKIGADLLQKNKSNETPFSLAIKNHQDNSDQETLKIICSLEILQLLTIATRSQLLLLLAQAGLWNKVSSLLDYKLEITLDTPNPDDKNTTLHYAAIARKDDIVKRLCEENADVFALNSNNKQAHELIPEDSTTAAILITCAKTKVRHFTLCEHPISFHYKDGFSQPINADHRCGFLLKTALVNDWLLLEMLLDYYIEQKQQVNFDAGPQIGYEKITGNTVLHLVVIAKQANLAKKLCLLGANPQKKQQKAESKEDTAKDAFQIAWNNPCDAEMILHAQGFSSELYDFQRCSTLRNTLGTKNWAKAEELLDAYIERKEKTYAADYFWRSYSETGDTILHLVVREKKTNLVKKLCQQGFSVDLLQENKAKETPLTLAIKNYQDNTDIATLQYLISPDRFMSLELEIRRRIILTLAKLGPWTELNKIIDHDTKTVLDIVDPETGNTVLHYAAATKNEEAIQKLFQKNVGITAVNNTGKTAYDLVPPTSRMATILLQQQNENLFTLARNRRWELVKQELKRDIKFEVQYLNKTLLEAAHEKETLIVELLCQKGAEPRHSGAFEMIKHDELYSSTVATMIFSARNFSTTLSQLESATAVYNAIRMEQWNLVTMLLARGEEIDFNFSPPESGNTLLHLVAAAGQFELVQKFCALGANPCALNKTGESVLQLACQNLKPNNKHTKHTNHPEIVRFLIAQSFEQLNSSRREEVLFHLLLGEYWDIAFNLLKNNSTKLMNMDFHVTIHMIHAKNRSYALNLIVLAAIKNKHDDTIDNATKIALKERLYNIAATFLKKGVNPEQPQPLASGAKGKTAFEMAWINEDGTMMALMILHTPEYLTFAKKLRNDVTKQRKILMLLEKEGNQELLVQLLDHWSYKVTPTEAALDSQIMRTNRLNDVPVVIPKPQALVKQDEDRSASVLKLAIDKKWGLLNSLLTHCATVSTYQTPSKQTALELAVAAFIQHEKCNIPQPFWQIITHLCQRTQPVYFKKQINQAIESKPLILALDNEYFDTAKLILLNRAHLFTQETIDNTVKKLIEKNHLNLSFLENDLHMAEIDIQTKRRIALSLIKQRIERAENPEAVYGIVRKLESMRENLHYLQNRQPNALSTMSIRGHGWKNIEVSATWVHLMKLAKNRMVELLLKQNNPAGNKSQVTLTKEMHDFLATKRKFTYLPNFSFFSSTKSLDILSCAKLRGTKEAQAALAVEQQNAAEEQARLTRLSPALTT